MAVDEHGRSARGTGRLGEEGRDATGLELAGREAPLAEVLLQKETTEGERLLVCRVGRDGWEGDEGFQFFNERLEVGIEMLEGELHDESLSSIQARTTKAHGHTGGRGRDTYTSSPGRKVVLERALSSWRSRASSMSRSTSSA